MPKVTDDLVLAERRGSVLVLTLNRPDRLNAWTDDLERRYFELLDEAEDDPEVRAIVVTGAGRGFCSGADMEDLHGAATGKVDTERPEKPRPRIFPTTVRKPLIAAINGPAVGLGLVEALYCDYRFATAEAKLSTVFARRGLVAEYGIAWILPRLIGPSAAMDLLLSGRVIQGEEALRLRLVDRISEPGRIVDDAVAYAEELAAHSAPWSMATIKSQIQDGYGQSLDEAYGAAQELMVASFRRSDVEEGVRSFMERRLPAFEPLAPRGQDK
ncbi:enoyl-CoA hydratase-related protein [Streptomyces cylindrosporus]|uniref:Enoyl-CoA hydratase-related protein n=1 Tax=Streptomyces cylindrosporus TaxID=2927583 RepID=A0ABS9Y899_9ACTN|nr:enoyl-CoA hydratase-related protein [Streptomyces cylindrosporus]MCI3273455.1 enoyl-CoA hydratase-related protein [Streptomyces cylindrosporus]